MKRAVKADSQFYNVSNLDAVEDEIKELIGAEEFLDEILRFMGSDERENCFDTIITNHDIHGEAIDEFVEQYYK